MDLTTGKFVCVFTKYTYIVEEGAFNPDRIYNMDETGHSTVQTCYKVISLKRKRVSERFFDVRTLTILVKVDELDDFCHPWR